MDQPPLSAAPPTGLSSYPGNQMIKNDCWIKEQADSLIMPFHDYKVRYITYPVISYGCSSYGYDLTLSPDDFRIFQHVPGMIVDPKAFDSACLQRAEPDYDLVRGTSFILPAHTYALGVTVEHLRIPDNITALFIGKSTYARCGIIVNTTPGEAGWQGHLTLEISNSSGADVRIYANEGICQALFFEGEPCDQPYGDGKYQQQGNGVTLAKV